jgi:hypothetical protein
MRVVQTVLQPFLYFIQNQWETSAVFSVVNNKCTLVTAVPRENTFSCTCGGGCQNGVVHFKQWAVTEFLVVEKQSIIRIHKRLKNIYGVNAVHKETASLLRFIKCRF